MNQPNTSLDRIVRIGECEAGMCKDQALAEISLDTLRFDPVTLEARAVPKAVKVCMRHKSEYFRYQDALLDKINPERKLYGQKDGRTTRPQTNVGYSEGFARRFRAIS